MRRLERIVAWTLAIIAVLAIAGSIEIRVCPSLYEFKCHHPLPAYRLVRGWCWWFNPQCE
jgi:hypothetical protein